MRIKRKKRKKLNLIYHVLLQLIIALSILAVIAIGSYKQQQIKLQPLASLPLPQTPTIYLPDPLIFSLQEGPVLGAQILQPRDIITYINNERMKYGSTPLRVNPILSKAAQMRLDTILKYQNFSHQDPYEGIELATVLPKLNYPFVYASENIGMGENTAKNFVNGFMSSISHKNNLLDPKLIETGVAVGSGPYERWYVNIVVQLFAIPTTKEKFLGYNQKAIEEYKELIDEISKQLELTDDFLRKNLPDEEYYEGWQKILIRQKEIVTIIYNQARKGEPLKDVVELIKEYNNNWLSVPKAIRS